MKIVIAGRPNTGKSTLFNQLTGTRDALVHNRPGVTRDAIAGKLIGTDHDVFDTAGLERNTTEIGKLATDIAFNFIRDADLVLFVVDARIGITGEDIEWAKLVRRANKKIILLANKSESFKKLADQSEFYKLGLGAPNPISAEHKTGFDVIYDFIEKHYADNPEPQTSNLKPLRISIMGQPNVGKSTLVNTIIGENRVIVRDEPGITRDTIKLPTRFYGRDIILADTAGLRRKANITDAVETLSALKSLDIIEKSDVIILVVDATRDIENQALGIAGRVYDGGKILCVALNKWDLVEDKEDRLLKLKHAFNNSFHQIIKPLILAISAETGTGVRNMFKRVYELWDISQTRAPTSLVNRVVEKLVKLRQPPMSRVGRGMKIKFATQVAEHPIKIKINVGGASDIPESYTRYLRRGIAKELHWEQLPIIIEYSKNENPFES
ncbi:MAG: ribosome biogenesis GTPase Der [Rickettsiales bacterium]|jgi:GTP-binding protein|nr:ribosome biogenesis GTPase Der [Rickettsiales bacterium]